MSLKMALSDLGQKSCVIRGDNLVCNVIDVKMHFLRGLGHSLTGFSGFVVMYHGNSNTNQNIDRLGSFEVLLGACP